MKKSDLVLSVFAVLVVSGLFFNGVHLLIKGEVASCEKRATK